MKRSKRARALEYMVLSSAILLTGWHAQAQENSNAPTQDDSVRSLNTVVVTTTRRETSLQDVAQSVAALDGDVQRLRGQTRLEDIQTSVPNVTFATTSNSSQLFIRGIGNTFINAGGDPGVAFYQDGAYVSDARTINTSLFDLERIEIMRGPQGALYGRNAVGGAVNVISARPTPSFEGRLDAVAGDYGLFGSEGYVSGPLGGSGIAGRLSYMVRELDGYTDNRLSGRPGAPDKLDDASIYALRGQLEFPVLADGTLTLLASYYNQDDAGPSLAVTSIPGVVYPAEALYGAVPTNDPRSMEANTAKNKLEATTFNLTLDQPVGDNTLTVIGNYRDGHQYFLNDCDGTAAEACIYFTDTSSEDYYAEAYLASPGTNRFQWIVGATYVSFEQDQDVGVPYESLLSYLDPAAPSNAPFLIEYYGGGSLETESSAVYADLRYEFNPVWAVTGQFRYGETTKSSGEYQSIASFGIDITGFRNALDDDSAPLKLSVEARPAPDLLLYLSYATANKDGAINIGAIQAETVDSEEVRSWEFGHKGTYFDQRLQLNAAVFQSDYEDLQIAQVVENVATLTNAPKASITGAELDAQLFLGDGLHLGASLGWLDAEFDEFSNSPTLPGLAAGPLTDLSGNQLPYVPEYTANLDAVYTFTPVSGYTGTLAAQYSWRSRTYFNEFNDPSNSEGAGAVVNLRASLETPDGAWRLYGYLNNVFDRTYQTGTTVYSGLLGAEKAVNYAPPRHFGIGLSRTF